MKQLISILVLAFLTVTSAVGQWVSLTGPEAKPVSVSLLEDKPSGTVIEFTTPGYYLNNIEIQGKTHSVLSVPKAVTFLEKGYPELPRISKSIVIPDEAKMKFEIVEAQYETTCVVPVAPSKGSLPRSIDPQKVPYTFSDVYKTDIFWPQQVIELSEPFIMRDIRGITVRFNLFRYNAVQGQLITCKRLVVRVFADGTDNVNVKTSGKVIITPDMIDTYERFFLNFSQRTVGALGKISYTAIGETGRMLIITADDFYNSMIPLRDWRTRKGNSTMLVKSSDVGTTADAVKTYIQNMYNSEGSVLYILFVGEANSADIPTKSVPSYEYPDPYGYAPWDPKYVKLAGGPTDPYPDAYISRISAENVAQVENQVMRILKYETNPVTGSWIRKACGIASHQSGYGYADSTRCNWLRTDLLGYGYTSVDKLYDITSSQPITNSVNNGRGVINFIGHGVETEWGFNYPYVWPLFSVSDVQNLTNTNLLPFIFSVACQVGSFNYPSTCFAEAWLRSGTKENPKGAIAFFGSSIGQDWVEPTTAQAEAVDLLVADSKITVGGLCFNGVCKMLEQHGSEGVDEAETWHIFGDAATQVWTKTPLNFTSASVTDNGSSLTVNTGVAGSTICVSSGNNGSSFWDRRDNVSSYTFNTPVRPLYITVTKHNYLPYTAVTGGTFASNEKWFGLMHVLGNVGFALGDTLSIEKDTKIFFNPGTRLAINGTLIAQGMSSNHIVFTSSNSTPSAGDWYGIRFEDSSSDANCILKYCDIKYAQYGIYCDRANPRLISNTISNNDQGISGYVASPTITDNKITGNTDGVYFQYGSPIFYNNSIASNFFGASFYSYASPHFGPIYQERENQEAKGFNIVKENETGIIARYYSEPFMGSTDPYNHRVGGYNSVYDNTYESAFLEMESYIEAEHNWWDDQYSFRPYTGCSIDYSNPLDSYPGGGSSLGKILSNIRQQNDDDTSGFNPRKPNVNRLSDLWLWANELQITHQTEEAINIYQILINKFPQSKEAKRSLVKIFHLYQEAEKSGLTEYLKGLTDGEKTNPELRRVAFDLLAGTYLRDGNVVNAVNTYDNILVRYPGTESEKIALYNLVLISNTDLKNSVKAGNHLQTLKTKYPNDELALLAAREMGEKVDWSLAKRTRQPEAIKQILPEKFALRNNYPNPFNPRTTIAFDLPEESHVMLTIYDIMGREIVRLLDENQPAGFRHVVWDSKDKSGQTVSSGIYFYTLKTSTGFSETKKMALMR